MALHYFPRFLNAQVFGSIPYPTADFSGQTIIVTGSNTGLGLEAARHVTRLGAAKVILGVRTTAKGETAANDIAKSCGVPRSRIEVWQLVMDDNESIKAFAMRAQQLQRLDGAILNAGILNQTKWTFFNGIESHIAVNVLGTILLAQLLLPILQQSAKRIGKRGRMAIIGSDIMMLADLREIDTTGSILAKLNDVGDQKPGQARYFLSKVLVKYAVQELADRYPVSKTNVIISDITPGMCKSDLLTRDDNGVVFRVVSGIIGATLARTTEAGSRTLVYGVDPALPDAAHGSFLWNNKIVDPGPVVSSVEAKRLAPIWNKELFAELERIAPGCTRS